MEAKEAKQNKIYENRNEDYIKLMLMVLWANNTHLKSIFGNSNFQQ